MQLDGSLGAAELRPVENRGATARSWWHRLTGQLVLEAELVPDTGLLADCGRSPALDRRGPRTERWGDGRWHRPRWSAWERMVGPDAAACLRWLPSRW